MSFRLWLVAVPISDRCLLDKLTSLTNLIEMLQRVEQMPESILDDFAQHRAALLTSSSSLTFVDVLRLVAKDESALVNPSFGGGWAALQLYPEQREVARYILEALRARLAAQRCHHATVAAAKVGGGEEDCEGANNKGALILRFCTPPSTGKSSAAAYIGATVHHFRTKEVDGVRGGNARRLEPCYVLYSCYSDSVRYDVAKTCVAASVPFAIITQDVACPSYYCFHGKPRKVPPPPPPGPERVAHILKVLGMCDVRPVVLIMDTSSAVNFLRFRSQLYAKGATTTTTGDLLLFDEPTASTGSTSLLRRHAELLALAPPITVLMSATLPPFSAFPKTLAKIRERLGEPLVCIDVTSTRIVSPCTIVDGARRAFGLHRLTEGSPANLLRNVQNHLHLLRFFSPRATLQLIDDISECCAKDAKEYVASLPPHAACTFKGIREAACEVLQRLPNSLTLPLLPAGDREKALEERYLLPRVVCMATTDAHLFPGTSIILSEDEDVFWETALPPLHEDALRLHRRRELVAAAKAKQEKMRVHVEGGRRGDLLKERRGGGFNKGKERESHMDRQREQEALIADAEKSELWLDKHCINTGVHAQRYKAALNPVHFKSVPFLQDDVLDSSHNDLLESLLSGLCTLHSRYANKTFLLAALDMAENQSTFTYISGGRSAIYGVNLPCDRVIINLDADTTDLASLIQCIGRCGRTGKYSQSEVVFSSHTLLRRLCATAAAGAEKDETDAPEEELDRLAALVDTSTG